MVVEIVNRQTRRKLSRLRLKKTAQKVLELLNQERAELSLGLVGNRGIQKLNARYRNRNEPTDVLAFPAGKALLPGMQVLGDVVISVEKAEEQARKRRKTLGQEIESLLIHGILHLLGYDHERSEKDAKIMRRMEKKFIERFVGRGR